MSGRKRQRLSENNNLVQPEADIQNEEDEDNDQDSTTTINLNIVLGQSSQFRKFKMLLQQIEDQRLIIENCKFEISVSNK